MRGSNTIISHYNYRVDPNIVKAVCVVCRIPFVFTACVYQLGKYSLPNCGSSTQPIHACFKNVSIKKYLVTRTIL